MTIYFCGDTHFGHNNIIELAKRQFKDVNEMNETIVSNWNRVVKDEDTVYFLGDFCFERGEEDAKYWLSRLKGRIIFIRGNHDHSEMVKLTKATLAMNIGDMLLVHDPYGLDYTGIIIHGHSHKNAKLFDVFRRRICVSCELIDYTPISLDDLMTMYKYLKSEYKKQSKINNRYGQPPKNETKRTI
jgi:calcineurin-like phosphoesterase family protein